MAEYRSHEGNSLATPANQLPSPTSTTEVLNTAKSRTADKQSVTAGKLMEVELGESQHSTDATKTAKPVKVRLGRDGKPWRPRRRRNSEDQARDALVESILKETPRKYTISSKCPTLANTNYSRTFPG
jgi:hypothetical protein